MKDISSITPTICKLMDAQIPALCRADALHQVIACANDMSIKKISKLLLYAPDAIGGVWLYEKYKRHFAVVEKHAPLKVNVHSVVPPKTPVCFASMFTGAAPQAHGVVWPNRPVLQCDTVFDALLRAGKRIAIIAVAGSSIDTMYRGRAIDYCPQIYDPEVMATALEVLASQSHDVVIVYNQEYDDALHASGPESPQAIDALVRHCGNFARLAEAASKIWRQFDHAMFFCPDHGCHYDELTGKGTHGADMPEDMDLQHFFGFARCR